MKVSETPICDLPSSTHKSAGRDLVETFQGLHIVVGKMEGDGAGVAEETLQRLQKLLWY